MNTTHFPQKIYKEEQVKHKLQESKSKLLPHIIGEYEYRITNKLLLQKIINPRRDKIIMDSLINASPKCMAINAGKSTFTNKSIYYRRKKNQKSQPKKSCKSSVFPSSKEHSVQEDFVNEIEQKTQDNSAPRVVNENSLRNESNLIGKIKRNHNKHISLMKNNYFMQNSIKCGQIVHQSCRNSFDERNYQQKCLKRIKPQQVRHNNVQDYKQNNPFDFQD